MKMLCSVLMVMLFSVPCVSNAAMSQRNANMMLTCLGQAHSRYTWMGERQLANVCTTYAEIAAEFLDSKVLLDRHVPSIKNFTNETVWYEVEHRFKLK